LAKKLYLLEGYTAQKLPTEFPSKSCSLDDVWIIVQRHGRGWCCCYSAASWCWSHCGGTYHTTTSILTTYYTLAGRPSLEQWWSAGEHHSWFTCSALLTGELWL